MRPGRADDIPLLHAILSEPSVMRWWREPEPPREIESKLLTSTGEVLLVIDIPEEVIGGIQYCEEREPDYHHATIDIYVGERWQGYGLGTEAIRLVAKFLFERRDHHRLTIDPSVENTRAIASYAKVGFKPVGVMRQYERQIDGRWQDGLLMDLLREELI